MKRGIPSATICSTRFVPVGRKFAQALGVSDLPIIEVHDEVGHDSPDELRKVAQVVADAVPDILRKYQNRNVSGQRMREEELIETLDVDAGTDLSMRVSERFLQENWSDGLPVVPPTEDRVQAMLDTVATPPDEVLGVLHPRGGIATVRKVAVCAVMAGCLPKHFPIVVAAVRALGTPQFKMHSVQSSAHPHSPFILVNGPAGIEAGLSSGHDCTPKGWQANLVICRAVRLVTINMAGLKNVIASHTQGHLGRIMDCVRENEEESPWEPYHTEQGYARDASTVTAFPGEPPHLVDDRGSNTAQSMLTTFARVIANGGNRSMFGNTQQIVLFAPEHAQYVASQGFSKDDVREFLYEVARVPLHEFPKNNLDSLSVWHKKLFANVSEHVTVPAVRRKEDFKIIVHGGIGPHSLYMPGSLSSKPVTVPVESKR